MPLSGKGLGELPGISGDRGRLLPLDRSYISRRLISLSAAWTTHHPPTHWGDGRDPVFCYPFLSNYLKGVHSCTLFIQIWWFLTVWTASIYYMWKNILSPKICFFQLHCLAWDVILKLTSVGGHKIWQTHLTGHDSMPHHLAQDPNLTTHKGTSRVNFLSVINVSVY